MLALVVEYGWREVYLRRALDTLRAAGLVALPNTRPAEARVVEERLRGTVPKATVGVAPYRQGDTAEDLLERAREAVLRGGAGNTEAT